MKMFHISDILSVTTERLVSTRRMEGVYDILNFLTGDNLYTHQIPRAMKECEPWLRAQFPYLFPESLAVADAIAAMDKYIMATGDPEEAVKFFIEGVRSTAKFPEMLPEMLAVYEMGADMHTRIDPIEELEAMVGKNKVIVMNVEGEQQ